jgi:hypothetical protein
VSFSEVHTYDANNDSNVRGQKRPHDQNNQYGGNFKKPKAEAKTEE